MASSNTRSNRMLRVGGRLTLYVSYLVVWAVIWGPAAAIAHGRGETMKAAVAAVLLFVPVVVVLYALLTRFWFEAPST